MGMRNLLIDTKSHRPGTPVGVDVPTGALATSLMQHQSTTRQDGFQQAKEVVGASAGTGPGDGRVFIAPWDPTQIHPSGCLGQRQEAARRRPHGRSRCRWQIDFLERPNRSGARRSEPPFRLPNPPRERCLVRSKLTPREYEQLPSAGGGFTIWPALWIAPQAKCSPTNGRQIRAIPRNYSSQL